MHCEAQAKLVMLMKNLTVIPLSGGIRKLETAVSGPTGLSIVILSCPDAENIRIRQKKSRHVRISLEPYRFQISGYQMKDMNIVFPIIPCGSL